MTKRTLVSTVLAVTAMIVISENAGTSASTAQGNIRLNVPQDNEPPFYARLAGYEFVGNENVFRTDEWAAIVFYRQPYCVPGNFNLLSFFDFSLLAIPQGSRCPLTVEGFEIWPAPPGPGIAPIHTVSWGLGAVPVWFVAWSEMQALLADRIVTVAELESASTLRKGLADFYHETLHPPAVGPITDAAQVGLITIEASGFLEAGAQFQFHATVSGLDYADCCFSDGTRQQVHIRFR
jgi:hypothetical protein